MKKKSIVCFTVIMIFLFGTVLGIAGGYSQKITAWFYDIKINLDGTRLGFYSQPFIYNGQVYVSMNDLANNMGLGVQWDDKNKVMNLSSNANNRFSINTLQQQLDQKNLEIANLKFQLNQKKLELDILRDHNTSSSSSKLSDLEKRLEDDYYHHKNDGRTLRFDNYNLSASGNEIKVNMYGDFNRTSSYWKSRDKSRFEDFIEDICEEIDNKFDKDIEVTVYDDDNKRTAEYTYDVSRDRIEEDYAYGGSHSYDDIDDLEEYLEDHYDSRRNNGRTLEFDNYELTKYNSEIDVYMYSDFEYTDREWRDLNESDFEDFIEDICEDVYDEYDKDVKVYIYDEDRTHIATCTYDEDDRDLDIDYKK